jgi:hypothetical protein
VIDKLNDFNWHAKDTLFDKTLDPMVRWERIGSHVTTDSGAGLQYAKSWDLWRNRWMLYYSNWTGVNYLSLRRSLLTATGAVPANGQPARILEPGDYFQFWFMPHAIQNQHMLKVYSLGGSNGGGGARRTDIEHYEASDGLALEVAPDSFQTLTFPDTPSAYEMETHKPFIIRWTYVSKNPNKQDVSIYCPIRNKWLNSSAAPAGVDMMAGTGDVTIGALWFEKQQDGSNHYSIGAIEASWEPVTPVPTANGPVIAAHLNDEWDDVTYPNVVFGNDVDAYPNANVQLIESRWNKKDARQNERFHVDIVHDERDAGYHILDIMETFTLPNRSQIIRQEKVDLMQWFNRIEVRIQ